eukprot:9084383-Alexandrium_andersonii.AAC.1
MLPGGELCTVVRGDPDCGGETGQRARRRRFSGWSRGAEPPGRASDCPVEAADEFRPVRGTA